MEKSPDAFRTIREVAEWLDTPAHVLRFWESRFAQVKPVKRAGGRRYYRPADMQLLGGIKKLLHEDGMTIKGVQKMLASEGTRAVAAYSQPLDHEIAGAIEQAGQDAAPELPGPGTTPDQRAPGTADSPVVGPEPANESEAPASEPEEPAAGTAVAEAADSQEPAEEEAGPQAPAMAEAPPAQGSPAISDSPELSDSPPAPIAVPDLPDDPEDDADLGSPTPVTALLITAESARLWGERARIAPLYERLRALRARLDDSSAE